MVDRDSEGTERQRQERLSAIVEKCLIVEGQRCRCGNCQARYFTDQLKTLVCANQKCSTQWQGIVTSSYYHGPLPEIFDGVPSYSTDILPYSRARQSRRKRGGRTIQIAWANPDYL